MPISCATINVATPGGATFEISGGVRPMQLYRARCFDVDGGTIHVRLSLVWR